MASGGTVRPRSYLARSKMLVIIRSRPLRQLQVRDTPPTDLGHQSLKAIEYITESIPSLEDRGQVWNRRKNVLLHHGTQSLKWWNKTIKLLPLAWKGTWQEKTCRNVSAVLGRLSQTRAGEVCGTAAVNIKYLCETCATKEQIINRLLREEGM